MSYRSVPAHDELHRDGESLVLHAGQVQRVSPLGTAIRALTVEALALEHLAEALEEQFGVPPEGDLVEVTREAAEALVDAGLLQRVSG